MSRLLPLFPLQLVAFPGSVVPLHIFEERYKEMIGEAEAKGSEIGIVLAKEGGIVNAGCTVVIESVPRRYPDGRFDVIARGRRRFEIVALDQEKDYLRGEVQYFDDDVAPPADPGLRRRAMQALEKIQEALPELKPDAENSGPDLDHPQLSFQLAQAIEDVDFQNMVQRSRSETERLRMFAEFAGGYIERRLYVEKMKHTAPRNGSGHMPAGAPLGKMSLSLYIDGYNDGPGRRPKRVGPLGMSAAAHLAAFFGLMHAPSIRLPEPAKSEYKQAIEGKEAKLVWYKFKELPSVTPPQAKPERKPLRAAVQAKQQIVASPKDAPARTRMVWTPAPPLQTKPVELPNILAIRIPEITKPFVAPPDIVKPVEAKIETQPDAPELQSRPLDPVKLTDSLKIVKRFVPPPRRVPERITEVVHVDDAPRVEVADAEAPALNFSLKAPTRPFTAPAAKKTGMPAKPTLVDAPAPDLLSANSHELNFAAVGLNPADVPIKLPESSSPAQFSAGPKIRPDGASAAGEGRGLNVPDLFVRGERDAKPDLIAEAFAAPTSSATLRAAARGVQPKIAADTPEPPHVPGAVRVSSAPDPRFNGREVYMMVIQMPNLTSYSGSWLMWYSDRTAHEAGLAPIAPPVAHRKVDPKYIAAAAADKIEGKVQLACVIAKDGSVSNVELVRGLDDRLNQSAEEALAKWEFTPATRHGEPVAVDVLVEIPFRLEHVAPVRY